jgi:hypothetical protein
MTRNICKFFHGLVSEALNKALLSLKNEGFSIRFAHFFILSVMISSSGFGSFAFIFLACFSIKIPLAHELCVGVINWLINFIPRIIDLGLESKAMILLVTIFIVLNLPVVLVIIIQKVKTRNLVRKYREGERNLIRP